jgi:hypothetical protein
MLGEQVYQALLLEARLDHGAVRQECADTVSDRERGRKRAAARADVVMLLLPDEIAPSTSRQMIAPHLVRGKTLVFASGYNITYKFITPPREADVVLVAPRMIGQGVLDLPARGEGFPVLVGVSQDFSGRRIHRERLEPVFARLPPAFIFLVADDYAMPAAAQIDRLRAALVTVPDDGDCLSVESRRIGFSRFEESCHRYRPPID